MRTYFSRLTDSATRRPGRPGREAHLASTTYARIEMRTFLGTPLRRPVAVVDGGASSTSYFKKYTGQKLHLLEYTISVHFRPFSGFHVATPYTDAHGPSEKRARRAKSQPREGKLPCEQKSCASFPYSPRSIETARLRDAASLWSVSTSFAVREASPKGRVKRDTKSCSRATATRTPSRLTSAITRAQSTCSSNCRPRSRSLSTGVRSTFTDRRPVSSLAL